MNAQTFLRNFETIADAPGGVQGLRDLVVELALSGLLAEQDISEGTGAELLGQIATERSALIQSGRLRRQKARTTDARPSPPGWSATDLGAILDFEYGRSLPAIQREQGGDVPVFGSNGIVGYHDEAIVTSDCVVVGRKGSAGAINISRSPSWPIDTTYFVIPLGGMTVAFTALLLRGCHLDDLDRATAVPGLNRADAYRVPVLLPPLAEQERIVAKVEELMGLCDELEAHQERRKRATAQFRGSALNALSEAETEADLQRAWQRLSTNWTTLIDRPDSVDELHQMTLRLATRGRLVEQRAIETPARDLLDQLAERRGRREPSLPDVARPALPGGWTWASFGEATINRDSERVPIKRADREGRQGLYDYYGASGVIDTIDEFLFDGELLLVGEDGANLVMRSTPIAFLASGQFWVNNHAHVLDSTDPASLRYLALFLNSIDLRPYLTGIAQPKLNQARMNRIPVPLPPLEEQQRIVERVEHLGSMRDRLRGSLVAETKERLALSAALTRSS